VGISDLGSINGTYVNGRRLAACEEEDGTNNGAASATLAELENGDIVTIGGTSLRVEMINCPNSQNGHGETIPADKPAANTHGECEGYCHWECLRARKAETVPDENVVVWEA
jgi:pSer/pThr/pTyr-binding forkhead associated (FHA) protein